MPANSVLIVDGDVEMHAVVQDMLSGTVWNAESANGSQDALVRLQDHSYDIVLTDIVALEIDGLEFLNRILSIRAETRIVVMTAANRPDRVAGSMRGHAAGYLAKPFSKAQLMEALTEALAEHLQPDDIEVLSDKPNWIAVRARCTLEIAGHLTRFFRELPTDLDPSQREAASLAFRELLTNAIEHGGGLDPEKKVELHFIRTSRSIVYYVRDPGQGFSLDELPHAAISYPDNPIEHVRIREEMGIRPGGFGLLLLNNFADELIYNSTGNEVILIKRL